MDGDEGRMDGVCMCDMCIVEVCSMVSVRVCVACAVYIY